ncbi:unnamed protein product, partial [Pocillopora meandrina]
MERVGFVEKSRNTPVISVPKRYKVTQMLAELEDILNKCRQLYQKQGNLKRFVPFVSTCPQGVDYAIILPEEEPSLEVIRDLEETSHDIFFSPKVYSKGGRDIIVPSIGLVTARDKHLSVCFSYFQ